MISTCPAAAIGTSAGSKQHGDASASRLGRHVENEVMSFGPDS
jgi:hypothetical protein